MPPPPVLNGPEPQSATEANHHFLKDLNEIQREDPESLHLIFLGTVPVFYVFILFLFFENSTVIVLIHTS